jgi:hypothetical protein
MAQGSESFDFVERISAALGASSDSASKSRMIQRLLNATADLIESDAFSNSLKKQHEMPITIGRYQRR